MTAGAGPRGARAGVSDRSAVPRRGGIVRSTSSTSTLVSTSSARRVAGDGAVEVDAVAGAHVAGHAGHEVELHGDGLEALGDRRTCGWLAAARRRCVICWSAAKPWVKVAPSSWLRLPMAPGDELAGIDLLGAELVLRDEVVGELAGGDVRGGDDHLDLSAAPEPPSSSSLVMR